jgi:hypothetical protein
MLNTKYIITRDGNLSVNSQALGNAWFVGRVRFVESAEEEIDALNDIVPSNSAVVHSDFSDQITTANAPQGGTITLEKYLPDHLTYKSSTTEDQIAIFSEIWYGPNKGWQAYVDGEPVDHFRANYVLRGMAVPAGDHTIEFIFDPATFRRGATISMISSILVLLLLLGGIYSGARGSAQRWSAEEVQPAQVTKKPQPTQKSRKKGRKKN